MALDLTDCQFTGPALPEPFVRFELEKELTKLKLLAKTTGTEGKQLKTDWETYRRHLAQLVVRGGPVRVRNHAVEPIIRRLGYAGLKQQDPVETREGRESGGYILTGGDDSARIMTFGRRSATWRTTDRRGICVTQRSVAGAIGPGVDRSAVGSVRL